LLAQAQQPNPDVRERDALTAMDLGARRLDLIGMKFELGDEIATAYAQAVGQQHDKQKSSATGNLLEEISSNNGRCQDLRDGFSAIKGEYAQVWLQENRPYWLNNVAVRYDLEIEKWQRRGDVLQQVIRDWENGKDLPAPATLGLPVPTGR
jgi:hypothetical protein